MTVKDLRQMFNKVPEHLTRKQFDSMQVIIPVDSIEFDGFFITPCEGESGVSELAVSEDEIEESFVLAPHGFFEEKVEDDFIPELN